MERDIEKQREDGAGGSRRRVNIKESDAKYTHPDSGWLYVHPHPCGFASGEGSGPAMTVPSQVNAAVHRNIDTCLHDLLQLDFVCAQVWKGHLTELLIKSYKCYLLYLQFGLKAHRFFGAVGTRKS